MKPTANQAFGGKIKENWKRTPKVIWGRQSYFWPHSRKAQLII